MREDLLEVVAEFTQQPQRNVRCTPVGGGSINNTFKVEGPELDLFVKVNSASRYPGMFEKEKLGLETLRASKAFKVPKVHGITEYNGFSFLLMEYIEPGRPSNDFNLTFAQELVRLHANTHSVFGLDYDNYIGSLVQENSFRETWTDFFLHQRLLPLAIKARLAGYLPRRMVDKMADLGEVVEDLFPPCQPSLLHGDLWSGNYLVDADGQPAIIDPAIYYGHPYMDLGMMYLFGGFDPEIFEHYKSLADLDPSWRQGAEFANLYPLLVHINLFGGGYVHQFRSIIDRYIT